MTAATIQETTKALDEVAGRSGFKCVPVSWEDAQRGTVGGSLSCWGANISDVRLWEKSGRQLYTLRSQNWNERLGYVASKDVAVVVGNEAPGAPATSYTPITLTKYLKNIKQYAEYAGLMSENLWKEEVDKIFTIRFQSVFLPINDNETTEFCTEVYNYNTMSDDDPRNLLLLCNSQGTSVQQDGAGAKKLFLHSVDRDGKPQQHWLEAERSTHKVGGAQEESAADAADAVARGKATALHIGTKAMGTRFNVQMMIQIPLKQKTPPPRMPPSMPVPMEMYSCKSNNMMCMNEVAPMMMCRSAAPMCMNAAPPRKQYGTSNAARVSRGTTSGDFKALTNTHPERDPSQHGTITVTLYYTVAGGVPSPQDVQACVRDLEELYKACPVNKRLAECSEVTAELTVKDTIDIQKKLKEQPPPDDTDIAPPENVVAPVSQFPTEE